MKAGMHHMPAFFHVREEKFLLLSSVAYSHHLTPLNRRFLKELFFNRHLSLMSGQQIPFKQ
ncbi:hypothetical protein D3870_06820 [Noviherbaspirillum cavernae]|uniref:Uncharacterized protein n=1 Tax=Noviherbaspirillum cavernae TaxID=2320862 RepID=A0A418WZU5_9BURK|nr:hypothetical protein D3870_06820 [Noviherbaspirillum cavernae]